MEKLFIGIDISKDVFDYCILSSKNLIIQKGQLLNNREGVLDFCNLIKSMKNHKPLICMEHTGHYGYLLSCVLTEENLSFSLLNPSDLKKSLGIIRGKNDAIDAYRIASYALSNKHKLTPYILPSEALQKLKVYLKVRSKYNKMLVQLKNSLKANKITNQTIEIEEIILIDQASIEYFTIQIKLVEQKMLNIIKSNEELYTTYKKITSVVGVGPLTAIYCIVETQNFTRFYNPRKFACHCGLAPFEYSSGSSIRGATRTSYLCNKTLKGILYKAAWSAIQHDPQLKLYYKRKLNEGKHKLSVSNAVAYKILLRIFAVAKREEPYVKLAA